MRKWTGLLVVPIILIGGLLVFLSSKYQSTEPQNIIVQGSPEELAKATYRGKIVGLSKNKIKIMTEDGREETYHLTPATYIQLGTELRDQSVLKKGQSVNILSYDKTAIAVHIFDWK